ncbi:MAG: 50S ribosome-binding GTPase [Desertifilum sp.]|nr:50S ribosome-binding GTPase [Desertifilum sp.]
MSDQAIDTLKLIFQDRPGLLEIIQLGGIESEQLLNSFRKQELFAAPINLYVTGRTGSGKTSLGNRLLNQSIMNSTGYQDCTDKVGFFKLASNLCYFDLPGAGSDEKYENINRAALLMEQRIDEDLGETPVTSFEVATYGNQGKLKKKE